MIYKSASLGTLRRTDGGNFGKRRFLAKAKNVRPEQGSSGLPKRWIGEANLLLPNRDSILEYRSAGRTWKISRNCFTIYK